MIAQAAGIVSALASAGLPEHEIHAWFDTTRRELRGMTPQEALRQIGPPAGATVLELAHRDACDLVGGRS